MKRSFLLPLLAGLLVLCMMATGVLAQWVYPTQADPWAGGLSAGVGTFHYGMLYITKVEVVGGSYTSASAQKKSEVNMDASLELGANVASSVQVEVTFYNSTDVSYYYNETQTVSKNNNNITYAVTGIAQKDEVPAKTFKTVTVTFSYSGSNTSAAALAAELHFNFVVDKDSIGIVAAQTAVQRFQDILNNVVTADSYQTLEDSMNNRGRLAYQVTYIGNVAGSGDDGDSAVFTELFGKDFIEIDLDGDGKPEPITMMIKRLNLDGNESTGDSYTYRQYGFINTTVNGVEMSLYITSEGFEVSPLVVYGTTFTKMPGSTEWIPIVPLTKGEAYANNYGGGSGANSFDTDTWVADNGKTMEQLVKEAMAQ